MKLKTLLLSLILVVSMPTNAGKFDIALDVLEAARPAIVVHHNDISNLFKTEYNCFSDIRGSTPLGNLRRSTFIYDEIEYFGSNANLNDLDVSSVTDMSGMFTCSNFNGDISKWDVSNVTNMNNMFAGSKFNGDISKWDVSNVTNMDGMFARSNFNGDISKWDVSNVTQMKGIFKKSKFKGDTSKWQSKCNVKSKRNSRGKRMSRESSC